MTIACTRCGATCEGDIIIPALAFGFTHNSGCGHGVGPLAVLPASFKSKKVVDTEENPAKFSKEEIKVEEKIEKTESRAERRRARQQKE